MVRLLYVHEANPGEDRRSLFLAGPSPRGQGEPDWRKQACAHLNQIGFDGAVYNPLPRDGLYNPNYDHGAQIDWELEHLAKAGTIVFWIPRDLVMLPGFTTNVEFGRFSRRGNVVLGYPDAAPKMRYLHHLANLDGVPVFHSMEQTLDAAVTMLPS
ncbi:nucleoside 2-deoxyribosyltransferase domain-containing protein [Asticcacaulis sp. AC402]|uniref:nucleoside 2-deoxyribosyltransferase domain-containing protein n=1 Tax=Asticcacaulis sp. AC402 TaxID=1282361 RepID=UPI00068B9A16|nr:nucleoside 2-deoxyribosyltransferase domain-containing protein [Asticcacaulis sp. AC402]